MKSQYYRSIKQFVKADRIPWLIEETEDLIEQQYTDENLEENIAHFSDRKPNRHSFAFNTSLAPTVIKCLDADLLGYEIKNATEAAYNLMGIPNHTRVLFNIQQYYDSSAPVPKHMDGQLLDYTTNVDGSLDIKKSIRPKYVAVLTLINNTDGGGIRLHLPDGTSEVVHCEPGELLIFDNQECYHSVDSFKNKGSDNSYARLIIGWRALEASCQLWEKDKEPRKLTIQEAISLHEQWLENSWPDIYQAQQKQGGAF